MRAITARIRAVGRRGRGWLAVQRDFIAGNIIAIVIGGIILAALLAGASWLLTRSDSGSGKPALPATATAGTTAAALTVETAAPDESTVQERDPEVGDERVSAESSAEFFSGRFVVSVGPINDIRGETVIARVVLRLGADERCEYEGARTGDVFGLAADTTLYWVEIRAVSIVDTDLVAGRKADERDQPVCPRLELTP